MKTSYKILWIDDEPGSIREDQENVETFLEKFGIYADISVIAPSEDESASVLIRGHIENPELDILLVDYHMEGMDGDELVRQIRYTDHVYLPVIFYSSSGIDAILKAAYDAQLDGVYFTDKNYIIQKFEEVALSLLNKEHTTKRTRGLLMEGVSEIDAKFKDVYRQVWEKLTEKDKRNLIKNLEDIIAGKAKDANKRLDRFPTDLKGFSSHMDNEFLSKSYDTYTRWRVVSKMLEYVGYNLDSREILKEFGLQEEGKLLKLRNTYAHTTRQELQKSHSTEKCVEIRRELRRQQSNIDHIVHSEE